MISNPTLSPLDYRPRLQLPNRRKIFGIYALWLLMYMWLALTLTLILGGGGQLPNPKSAILR